MKKMLAPSPPRAKPEREEESLIIASTANSLLFPSGLMYQTLMPLGFYTDMTFRVNSSVRPQHPGQQ
jgi:hypothetical protein